MYRLLTTIPFFGVYLDFSLDDYREAFTEFVVTMLFALAPLWVGASKLYFFTDKPYMGSLRHLYSSGELMCYSAAFLGPVIYSIVKDRSILKRFPNKTYYLVFAVVGTFLSPFAFPSGGEFRQLPEKFINWSEGIFLASIFIYYSVLVTENWFRKRNPAEMMAGDTDDFVSVLGSRRK